MQPLTTPVTPTLCGTAINGTDEAYLKVIFEADLFPTTDKISITLYIGCYEDEDWTDEESYEFQHQDFEAFMESGLRLYFDDISYDVDARGELIEKGRAGKLPYGEYVTHYLQKHDVIAYLKHANHIPDYIIDKDL